MRRTKRLVPLAASLLALLVLAPSAFGQSASITTSDIERLENDIADLNAQLPSVRSSDPDLANRLERDLDDVRDEVTYLKVKVRKEGVTEDEYEEVRTRIEDVRRAMPRSGDVNERGVGTDSENSDTVTRTSAPGEIPVGQEMDVRLQTPLSSETAQVEDRFEATTLVDIYQGNELLVPAGSLVRGVVSSVQKAGRLDRKGSLTLAFDRITVRGVDYPIRATVTQALESEGVKGEAARIGIGAAAGAILGGILGGAQGAIAGIFIGSGGVLAAVPGKDVELDAGTVLRIRFDSPALLR
jgi:hypothetical protein